MDFDGIAPAVAALVDPERDLAVLHVKDVCPTVTVHVFHEDAIRVITVRKARAILHMETLAPVPVTTIGPILDVAVIDQYDVLPRARHTGYLDARVRKVHIGKDFYSLSFDPPCVLMEPSLMPVIKETF